jgi:hypothetical protein
MSPRTPKEKEVQVTTDPLEEEWADVLEELSKC